METVVVHEIENSQSLLSSFPSSHPVNGKVVFSSSEDLETNVKKVSGSATEQGKEDGHVIPGNV